VYEDYAEQADNWLSSKEAFLANDDVGVSALLLQTGEGLFKTHLFAMLLP